MHIVHTMVVCLHKSLLADWQILLNMVMLGHNNSLFTVQYDYYTPGEVIILLMIEANMIDQGYP